MTCYAWCLHAPDRETAERIGEALLRERLAACVQYEAVRSQYLVAGGALHGRRGTAYHQDAAGALRHG